MIRIGRASLDYDVELAGGATATPIIGIHGHAFVGIVFDGTVPAGSIVIRVGGRKGDLKPLNDGSADVTLTPQANKAVPLPATVAGWQRVELTFAALGAAATWKIVGKG